MGKLARFFLLWALFSSAGCMVAEIKSQNQATDAENRRVYEVYVSYLKTMNEQREKFGALPVPIMSFEQWQRSAGRD
jgi:hypothetical protein